MDIDALRSLVARLIETKELTLYPWTEELSFLKDELGLQNRQGNRIGWDESPTLIDEKLVSKALDLDHFYRSLVSSSTNTELLERGSKQSIGRNLVVTEWQVGGRGRRGRTWNSAFAKHLTFSYGHRCALDMSQLGGLSLVVGLVVCEVINRRIGQSVASLKWPNDLLCDDKKVCGILVELSPSDGFVEAVIGIGLNIELSEKEMLLIDQPVTDLRSLGIETSRSDLLIELVNTLQVFLARFEESGFEPFIDAFNKCHIYHGRTCNIHQGDTIITGRVEGVDHDGALILSTENGIRSFHGGEVSLRAT